MPDLKVVEASDPVLGKKYLYVEGDVPLFFTENETNNQRILKKKHEVFFH